MHQSSNHSKFQRMRRRLDLFRQKKEEQSVSHPLRACLPFLCATGVLMTTVVTAASCTLCYRVDAQGQSLAFFHDVATYDAAVSQAETRASKILETQYSLNQDLSVRATLAPKDQIESLSGVTGSLMESIPELEHVYTLSVDGTMVGAAQDPSVITQALNLVKERYTTPETRSLHIDSQVDIRYQYLPADTGESTAEEMAAALLAQSPRTFSYTTQPGDTMESVTALFSMTEERFRELNPDLTLEPAAPTASSPLDELPDNEAADAQVSAAEEPSPDSAEADSQADENVIDLEALLGDQLQTPLEAGLTITIEQSCPLLVVSTVEEMNLTREILPDLETQEDDTMFQGQQRIIQEGEAGQSSVLSRVVKRCGVPVASNDLSAVTLSEATPLIVGTGTKAMPELPDGCLFLWPVQGPITSEFGYRFIFGENNFHRGLDIAAAAGTAPSSWSKWGIPSPRVSPSLRWALPGGPLGPTATLRCGTRTIPSTPCSTSPARTTPPSAQSLRRRRFPLRKSPPFPRRPRNSPRNRWNPMSQRSPPNRKTPTAPPRTPPPRRKSWKPAAVPPARLPLPHPHNLRQGRTKLVRPCLLFPICKKETASHPEAVSCVYCATRSSRTFAADRANSRAPASASSRELPCPPTSTSREPLVSCWLNRAVRRVMGRARPGQREFICCWICMARAKCSPQSGKEAPASSVPTSSITWAVLTPSI